MQVNFCKTSTHPVSGHQNYETIVSIVPRNTRGGVACTENDLFRGCALDSAKAKSHCGCRQLEAFIRIVGHRHEPIGAFIGHDQNLRWNCDIYEEKYILEHKHRNPPKLPVVRTDCHYLRTTKSYSIVIEYDASRLSNFERLS